MIKLLDDAINQIKVLPESEQEKIALLIMKEVSSRIYNNDDDDLGALLERCKIKTGISDLAEQHHHYIHGTPKIKDK